MTNQMLHRVLILVLCIAVLYNILTAYWLIKKKYYNLEKLVQPDAYNEPKANVSDDDIQQVDYKFLLF